MSKSGSEKYGARRKGSSLKKSTAAKKRKPKFKAISQEEAGSPF